MMPLLSVGLCKKLFYLHVMVNLKSFKKALQFVKQLGFGALLQWQINCIVAISAERIMQAAVIYVLMLAAFNKAKNLMPVKPSQLIYY